MVKSNYEDEALRDMPDGIMRPGGLDFTKRLSECLMPGARILDAGCGHGAAVRFLRDMGFDAVGIDISGTIIGGDSSLLTADAEALPFEDNSFDAVMYECSLSLMDADKALTEARRVLRRGGQLLIADVFSGADCHAAAGIFLRTKQGFIELLNQNGFTVTYYDDKTRAFEEFIAQLIMSTGSIDTLFDCNQWLEIKKAKPRYCLAAAREELIIL